MIIKRLVASRVALAFVCSICISERPRVSYINNNNIFFFFSLLFSSLHFIIIVDHFNYSANKKQLPNHVTVLSCALFIYLLFSLSLALSAPAVFIVMTQRMDCGFRIDSKPHTTRIPLGCVGFWAIECWTKI